MPIVKNPFFGTNRILKVMMVGNTDAGKSCLLHRYTHNEFETVPITIGPEIESRRIEPVKVNIFDIGGREKLESIALEYIPYADIVYACYSVWSTESFYKIRDQIKNRYDGKLNSKIPIVLIATAADHKHRAISYEKGLALAREVGAVAFYECSAKTGKNVVEAIERPILNLFNHKFYPSYNCTSIDEIERPQQGINNPIYFMFTDTWPKKPYALIYKIYNAPVLDTELWKERLNEISSGKKSELTHFHFGKAGLDQLINVLQDNKNLSELELGYNELGLEGAKSIGQFMLNNTQIRKLNLTGNQLADEGTKELSQLHGMN